MCGNDPRRLIQNFCLDFLAQITFTLGIVAQITFTLENDMGIGHENLNKLARWVLHGAFLKPFQTLEVRAFPDLKDSPAPRVYI